MLRSLRWIRRRPIAALPFLLAFALAGILSLSRFDGTAHAFPVPAVTYRIDAFSGSHHASLLNLPVGQPGVIQAPIPVDVDGDFLPDVTVSVNLLNVNGLFNNPPKIGSVLAPNVQINRLPTAPLLGQNSPPLRIYITYTLADSAGGPSTSIRFGYDTKNGGSIPTFFSATLGGLTSFFNPLEAVVDTTGGPLGLHTGVNLGGLGEVGAPYQGPLTLVAGFTQAPTNADIELQYRPFPQVVDVTYGTDSHGQHITYAHGLRRDVGLTTTLKLTTASSVTNVVARVDRMPRSIGLDIANQAGGGGSLDYRAMNDGRPPDAHVVVGTTAPGQRPLNATVDIESIPSTMHADWSLPTNGPAHAAFTGAGQGIGAIEADVTNYAGTSPLIKPFVPAQQQYLNLQQVGTGANGPDMHISGRVERVRAVSFTQAVNGSINATAQLGDGELPLLAHVTHDDRVGTTAGHLLEATATMTPLPDSATISFQQPSDPTTQPMIVSYQASQSVDADTALQLFNANAGATCGTHGTICATLKARHLPTSITASIENFPTESHIDLTAIPRAGGQSPDFFADATLGQTNPALDDFPLIAHAELLRLPQFVRIFTHDGADLTLDKAEFHACNWDFTALTCAPGTDQPVGSLSFALHNWTTRPVNLPPPSPTTAQFANLVARGTPDPTKVRFEAAGKVVSIDEIDYRNTGDIFGVRTKVGSGRDFSTHVDLGDVNFTPSDPTKHRLDIVGDANIVALPSAMDFCFRQSNKPVAAPSGTFTAPCEAANPFGDSSPLTASPISVAYRASAPFNVKTAVAMTDRGANDSLPFDDHVIKGVLNIANLPADLTFHLQTPPPGQTGRMRALYCAGSQAPDAAHATDCPTPVSGDPQVNIDFSAQSTDAQLVCKDPRTGPSGPQPGQEALCASGRLENLPNTATLIYDPTKLANNFSLVTSGENPMNLTGFGGNASPPDCSNLAVIPNCFEVSSVTVNGAGKPQYLVGNANITGLPRSLVGTLNLPKTVDLSTTDNPIQDISASVRNFIAPDPTPSSIPAQRTDLHGTALPAPDEQFVFLQRGTSFKAAGHVTDLHRVGYTTAVSNAPGPTFGAPLDTKIINVDFGQTKNIRAYADLNDGTSQLNGDVTLTSVPAGVQVCFRGAKTLVGTPNIQTFCDAGAANGGPTDTQGGFQFIGRNGASLAGLGLHAFFRQATAGGTAVLAGATDITGIPPVVQGTFGGGQAKVGGFGALNGQGVGITPTGIANITAELANSDIATTGYGANPPWDGAVNSTLAPFDPVPSGQFVRLADNDTNFHIQASIDNLQGVAFDNHPCAQPASIPGIGYVAPTDFPYLPTLPNGLNPAPSYTCVRADFTNAQPNPLSLYAVIDRGGKHIALHDAGLSTIPAFIQADLATAQTADVKTTALVRPCGSAAIEPAGTTNCVPPMIRVDTPGNATLFGVLELGAQSDLNTLSSVTARDPNLAPALAATPTATTWSAGPNVNGVRVSVGTGGSAPAVHAALRIPVPKSLTVDQFQSFDCSGPDHSGQPDQCNAKADTQTDFWQASDLRFHYVLRGANDQPQSPGELTAMIAGLIDGSQTLVSDPTQADHGITIPGELGIGMYIRDYKGTGQKFIQLDGRTSSSLSAKAQILSGQGDNTTGITAQVLNVPAIDPSDPRYNDPLFPSFRLRAQMEGPAQQPPSMGGGGPSDLEKALLCIVFCIHTDVHVQSIDANFNFNPQGGATPARLVSAVVNQAGSTKNGVEVRGNSDVNGTGSLARVSGGANIVIDPLNIFFHVGIPVLADFDFVMLSDLSAGAHIGYTGATPPATPDGTTDFWLRENLLNITADNQGPGQSELTLQINIHQFHALLFSIFGFLPFLGGNPVLLGIDFLPPSPPSLHISYRDCAAAGFGFTSSTFDADPTMTNPRNMVAWPLDDPRFIFYGTLGNFINVLARFLGAPLLCAFSAPSASDLPLIDSTHPGEPLDPSVAAQNADLLASHPVPPGLVPVAPAPPPPPTVQTLPALNVPAGPGVSLCGDKNYSGVSISGPLLVATVASGTDCPAGSEGRLHIVVTRNDPALDPSTANTGDFVVESGGKLDARNTSGEVGVVAGGINIKGGAFVFGGQGRLDLTTADPSKSLTIAGSVTANGQGGGVGTSPAVPNGGGGHGGAGQAGVLSKTATGAGGGTFGNTTLATDPNDGTIVTESGAAGSSVGTFAGAGGGQIALIGQTVRISGTLAATGIPGGPGNGGTAGDCSVAPFVPGGGGGAGGAISISATTVDATGGAVSVQGGPGGAGGGGGGGGGGGIVSVVAPVTLNFSPQVGGGLGGGHICDLAPQGSDGHGQGFNGNGGVVAPNNNPASRAESTPNAYWFKGSSVPVPITAAAAITPASHNFQVVLCGMNRGPGASDPDSMGKTPQDLGFTMPSRIAFFGPAVDQPCGFSGATELSETDYNGKSQSAVGDTMNATSLSTGYEAVWTIIMKSDTDSVSCYHGGVAAAPHCFVENIPSKPESIFGVDNDPPAAFTLTATPTVTNNPNITLHVSGVKDVEGHLHDDPSKAERVFSGVKAVDCSNDGSTFTQCDPVGDGDRAWTVTPGSGQKTISVRVTDQAGNTTTENVTVTLDAVGPTVLATADSSPDRANNWYSASPTFTIHWSKLLPPPFMAGPGTPAIQYHFDGGPAIPCTLDGSSNCHITTGLPLHGPHTLYYQGFDSVGNVSAVQSVAIKIDGVGPKSALLGVPATPDGANNWYVHTTFFTVSTLDEPGGSGLVPSGSDTPGAGVYVAVDAASFPATAQAPPVPTVQLSDGPHTVCWYVQDVAGNLDLGGHGFVPTIAQAQAAGQCKSVMVDTGAPAVSILPTPTLPNASGWYTQSVSVAVAANDGISGSGVNPAFDAADTALLCAPQPKTTDPRPSGVCISIDGAPFVPYAGAVTIPEGVHDIRTFAVDVSGQRSTTVELPINVDLSPPVATARTRPPDPALAPWFRTLPVVVLRAVDGDQNSGVASIQYRIDGGPLTTYTGPFTVPESPPLPRAVTYWATDVAGLVQPVQTLNLPVDQTPPVVVATSPTPAIWLQLLSILGNLLGLSPPTAQLNWTVSDNTSPHVHMTVIVYNATGAVVRQIDGGTVATTPGVTVTGATAWDGTDQTITNVVPVGLYYYRVVATDDAGNIAQSGESRPIQIKASLGL